eukprot:2555579-Prymnesium_polylepis.2
MYAHFKTYWKQQGSLAVRLRHAVKMETEAMFHASDSELYAALVEEGYGASYPVACVSYDSFYKLLSRCLAAQTFRDIFIRDWCCSGVQAPTMRAPTIDQVCEHMKTCAGLTSEEEAPVRLISTKRQTLHVVFTDQNAFDHHVCNASVQIMMTLATEGHAFRQGIWEEVAPRAELDEQSGSQPIPRMLVKQLFDEPTGGRAGVDVRATDRSIAGLLLELHPLSTCFYCCTVCDEPFQLHTPARCAECEAEFNGGMNDFDGHAYLLHEAPDESLMGDMRQMNLERVTWELDKTAKKVARSVLRAWHNYVQHTRPSAVARIVNPVELVITAAKLIESKVTRVHQVGVSLGEKLAAFCLQPAARDAATRLLRQRNRIAHDVVVNELTNRDAFLQDFQLVMNEVKGSGLRLHSRRSSRRSNRWCVVRKRVVVASVVMVMLTGRPWDDSDRAVFRSLVAGSVAMHHGQPIFGE